jgi:hypothetical protein
MFFLMIMYVNKVVVVDSIKEMKKKKPNNLDMIKSEIILTFV